MGYHKRKIKKGKYGKASKIREEYQEFRDALEQKNKVMALVELSDLIGAIEKYLENKFPGISINDLLVMTRATKSAFRDGSRK